MITRTYATYIEHTHTHVTRSHTHPQGRKLYPILGLLEWVVPSIARCLSWLPVSTVKSIIRWKLGPQPPECIVDATHQVL